MQLPPLYPVTDARLEASLSAQIRALGEAGYPLVQFRGKPLDTGAQWRELATALGEAADRGGWPAICVNDRADLAVLAAGQGLTPWGLHLGQGDLPASDARRLPGLEAVHLGASTAGPGQWNALDPACDHAGIGPVRATDTKPDAEPPVGLDGLRIGAAAMNAAGVAPVAIGGLTAADAAACFQAGAESVCMVGEVARSADPRELLWKVQEARWAVRPLLTRGRGVALAGGSGAGKSTLALELAARLGLPAVDADQAIGADIPALFRDLGEAGFRALEAATVARCAAAPCVLALGAGAWEDPASRRALRAAGFTVLWLAEVPERAWARVGGDPQRPLAADRAGFMGRYATRAAAWWALPMVLPLGRPARLLAEAMVKNIA